MRENIGLFRGKRKDNGEWVEGWLIDYRPYREWVAITVFVDGSDGYTWRRLEIEVDPASIGECTSLKDKNGKLIFEGDVYQYFDDEIQIVEWDEEIHNIGLHTLGEHEVKKGRKTEKRKFEGWNALCDFPLEEMDYLGNIHDNPELLKGGEG